MSFSLGLIEVDALGNAIYVLDAMTKAAEVEFVATERKLGGRLVSIVVKGNVSAVTASVEAGKEVANEFDCLKAAEVIARPHNEILKFLHLDKNGVVIPVSETAGTHTGPVGDKKHVEEKKPETKKPQTKVQKAPEKKVSKTAKAVSDKKAPSKKGAKK
ncbi:MAG: BMC domain-containing protein [Clostridia bacterium]|nr:BMC domain-containing protein [Clostridia bacterium]